ncbi:DUF1302 domain-containing protein [Solimonas marina]|uniref:DUF1302 domain-containing protein n=1 Tax=Solimonas marina TaxID=2714601 RepID=A0A970B8J8_9GAMM|nr:DUF1302 domain-containing protein [Solimonas marina]NKF21456.1 DUF1302 domain-containing protein [Solimonas marina]
MSRIVCGAALLLCVPAAWAADWQFGDVGVTWNNKVGIGAAMRMQKIDYNDLVGKLSVPGQQDLCASDDCFSLNGDTTANQRLVDARGAFSGVNGDDGDLNYKQYDIVAAVARINTDLTLSWNDWTLRGSAIGFFDPVNSDFDERHTYTAYQPSRTSRPGKIKSRYSEGVKLYNAYLQYAFTLGERQGSVSIGNQVVRWGESTFIALNSLSQINPPDSNMLHMPGSEFSEVFQPVPLALFSVDLFSGLSTEVFYQLGWRRVQPDARGSFYSDSDIPGGGDYAMQSLGQFGEDPNGEFHFAGPLGLISNSTDRTLVHDGRARNGGQYGIRLNYYADWLNGGTEVDLYYMNYHSRLPLASAYAADDSCTRDESNVLAAYTACNGFNGSLPLPKLRAADPRGEPLPLDTTRVVLEYPEDIHMFGVSFNTNIGRWSLAGEYAYRPNLPVQVQLTDLIFTALQPAFPAQSFSVTPGALSGLISALPTGNGELGDITQLLGATFPSADEAVPSYIKSYRGLDRIVANQYVRGYERLHVSQLDMTAIRAFSNTLGADQLIFIAEAGFTHILNMPKRRDLQLEGAGLQRTHYSPGADGTGTPDGQPDPTHLNPTQQRAGFADAFSWGLRFALRGEYNNLLFGWTFKPTLGYFWDVHGIAPSPMQNFVEGRKEIAAGTDVNFTQSLSGRVVYQWYTGGGWQNTRRDRDNLALSFSYSF